MSQEHGQAVVSRVVAGRYAIQGELGRGGMGVVWLAEDTTIGRHVAIKELHLPDGVAADERKVFEERVLREARTAGRLNDPAVVTVYDVVQEAGATFIVMELIQAPTLSDVVRTRGALPQDQVARLAEQLLSALEAAHRAGIVHRDVKPSNIMLAPNGRVKLTDFGIAQSLDDPRLTTSGLLIGSPTYMAPERIRGEEATGSSDLWALGAVLFFAIEGYSPFERTTTAATMHAILNDVPYLTRAQGALASVITGLMVTTPQARLNGAQVRGLLSHVQFSPQQTAPVHFPQQTRMSETPPKRSRWKLGAALAAALVLAGAVGGFFLNRALTAPDAQEVQVAKYTYGVGGDFSKFNLSNGYCGEGELQRGAVFTNTADCKESHEFQVFGTLEPVTLSTESSYAKSELEALGESYCAWLFGTERIATRDKDQLTFAVVLPTEQTWTADSDNSGDRTLNCVVTAKSGAPLRGSSVVETN
ncbi:MAG: protein kinase [Actinomycetota bacterium]|nr:protein kinase [Actinomycetota bacterium]